SALDPRAWNMAAFRSPHSRLHNLEPVGMETAAVESLTGYISRLAGTHGVTTRTLMIHELLPLFGRDYLIRPVNSSLSSFLATSARPINGTGHSAEDMVSALQALTLRQDLRFLTLLTWSSVLPSRGLLRHSQVWCPFCFNSWWETGQVIYEPLLWSLKVVTVCPIHHCYLVSTCPYPDCLKTQPILGSHAQPGHCSHCNRWLGFSLQNLYPESRVVPKEECAWQTWVTQEVGALLATAPAISAEPTIQNVCSTVNRWVDLMTEGQAKTFARQLQISESSIDGWRFRKQRPLLGTLLRLCHLFGTSLKDVFILGQSAVIDANFDKDRLTIQVDRPKRLRRTFDYEKVRKVLLDVLDSKAEPPLPMRQVSKTLGYENAIIYNHFPDQCRAISARFMAYQKERGEQRTQQLCAEVRRDILVIHEQGKYPSAYRVEALLSVPGFMRHPMARVVWHATLRELGWES
ncbi:MAG: TniQ family protein, partial [Chloroflexi bacterium]|nr:TniQ family protein [Chloroflexota bacterium]